MLDAKLRNEVRVLKVGSSPSRMTMCPDNRSIFVAKRGSDTVSVINLADWTTVATIPVGKAPFGLTFDRTGPCLWVAIVQLSDVSVADPVEMKDIRRINVCAFPYEVAVTKDGARPFITNQHDDNVSLLDGHTYRTLATLRVGDYPEGILISPHQRHALVPGWMDDILVSIGISTLKVDARFDVRSGPAPSVNSSCLKSKTRHQLQAPPGQGKAA